MIRVGSFGPSALRMTAKSGAVSCHFERAPRVRAQDDSKKSGVALDERPGNRSLRPPCTGHGCPVLLVFEPAHLCKHSEIR
jgi:hypothetical protein